LGAHHYGGWNQDGIIRFNQLCQKVKEDRENNPITEELYKAHCLTTAITPKKMKTKIQEFNSYVDDMTDLV